MLKGIKSYAVKNSNFNDSIMRQSLQFLFSFLGNPKNAPFTMSFVLLFFLASWNIWQQKEHAIENYNWRLLIAEKDSADRRARLILYDRINTQNSEISACKAITERLEEEIKQMKKEIKKRY